MKISPGFKRITAVTPGTSCSPVLTSPKACHKVLTKLPVPEISLEMFKNVTNIKVNPVTAIKKKSVKPGIVRKEKQIRKRRKYNTKKNKKTDVRFIFIYKKKIQRLERSDVLFNSLIKLVN